MLDYRKETAKNIATRTIILLTGSEGFLPSMIITYLAVSEKYA